VFEKSGTFINQQFRIQKFSAAVPGPAGATDDLAAIASLLGAATPATEINALWAALAADVPALAPLRYGNIPDTGLLLDGTPWAHLPFAEGKALHHQPAPKSAPSP